MTCDVLGPDAVTWMGFGFKTILSSADTGGAMSVVDSVVPAGSGPPRHVHQAEDECFVVLTGEIEFWLDGETFTRGPGGTAFIPRGKEHTFQVIGGEPSRHIVVLTPGGFERFFHEMAERRFALPDDMDAVNAAAARHNLAFTGPPLGAH